MAPKKVINLWLVQLLEEWLEAARQAQNQNKEHSLRKAIRGVRGHDRLVTNGKEAQLVPGIGPTLGDRINTCIRLGTTQLGVLKKDEDHAAEDGSPVAIKALRAKSSKMYIPTYRSGPYAIIKTLYEEGAGDGMLSKDDIIESGQKYCDSSFTIASAGKLHTAWSSCKTLQTKGLVIKQGGVPAKFSLSEAGLEMAEFLLYSETSSFQPRFTAVEIIKKMQEDARSKAKAKRAPAPRKASAAKAPASAVGDKQKKTSVKRKATSEPEGTTLLSKRDRKKAKASNSDIIYTEAATSTRTADSDSTYYVTSVNVCKGSYEPSMRKVVFNTNLQSTTSTSSSTTERTSSASSEYTSETTETTSKCTNNGVDASSYTSQYRTSQFANYSVDASSYSGEYTSSFSFQETKSSSKTSIPSNANRATSKDRLPENVPSSRRRGGADLCQSESWDGCGAAKNTGSRERSTSESQRESADNIGERTRQSHVKVGVLHENQATGPPSGFDTSAAKPIDFDYCDELGAPVSSAEQAYRGKHKMGYLINVHSKSALAEIRAISKLISDKMSLRLTKERPGSCFAYLLDPTVAVPLPCSRSVPDRTPMKRSASTPLPKPEAICLDLTDDDNTAPEHSKPSYNSFKECPRPSIDRTATHILPEAPRQECVVIDSDDDDIMLNIPLRERLATSKKNLENPMQSSSVLSPDTDFITVERDAFSVATSTSAANLFTASTKSDSINAYDCSTDKGNDSSRRTRAYTDIGTTSEEGSSDTHAYTESSTIRGKSSVSSRSRSPVSKQSLHKEDFGEGQTSANNGAIFSVFVHAANKTYPKPLKPIRSKSSDTQKNADSAATQITSTSPAEIEPLKVTLDSGSYDIWMVIDNREIFGKKDRGYLQEKLAKNGVKCIVRAMQLGDFTWVAKEKRTIDEAVNTMSVEQPKEQDREIMLGYLGERKRMDDLCASVMDGRFVEQMSRLKKCHVSRCMYLIENYGKMDKLTLSQAALESSIARIQVHSGMQVTRTDNIEHTVRYLTYFTKYLMDLYKDKAVTSDPAVEVSESTVGGLVVYSDYVRRNKKSQIMTVQLLFAKQLMCIKGMTPERARAVIDIYPCTQSLLKAYSVCDTVDDMRALLAPVEFDSNRKRTIGRKMSDTIYNLYRMHEYGV